MSDMQDAIPAATLILMRPRLGAAPDLLVMERAANMAFAAGALVFPGGRIDPDDHRTAERLGMPFDDAAARVAAIRETIEETGIAPAMGAVADIEAVRAALANGAPFSELVETYGIAVDLAALTPFARWCPNFREGRRFDTLFYVAEAPPGATAATPDENEAVRTFWASAAEILDQVDAGAARAIFPTRRNLERLARFGSVEEARADVALHPVRKILPWVEDRDGEAWLCIPDDAGYPVTAERVATARRG